LTFSTNNRIFFNGSSVYKQGGVCAATLFVRVVHIALSLYLLSLALPNGWRKRVISWRPCCDGVAQSTVGRHRLGRWN
jgi:hypothetical protein